MWCLKASILLDHSSNQFYNCKYIHWMKAKKVNSLLLTFLSWSYPLSCHHTWKGGGCYTCNWKLHSMTQSLCLEPSYLLHRKYLSLLRHKNILNYTTDKPEVVVVLANPKYPRSSNTPPVILGPSIKCHIPLVPGSDSTGSCISDNIPIIISPGQDIPQTPDMQFQSCPGQWCEDFLWLIPVTVLLVTLTVAVTAAYEQMCADCCRLLWGQLSFLSLSM